MWWVVLIVVVGLLVIMFVVVVIFHVILDRDQRTGDVEREGKRGKHAPCRYRTINAETLLYITTIMVTITMHNIQCIIIGRMHDHS